MLIEINIEDANLLDLVYFKWDAQELKGPYLVIGWNREWKGDKLIFIARKPKEIDTIVIVDLRSSIHGHFTRSDPSNCKFYKSDAIFLQETL